MARVRMKVKGEEKDYTVPSLQRYAHITKNESIIVFDAMADDDSGKRMCMGIGRVTHIEHGETMDIVFMNFGRTYGRRIVVVHNHARRQIYGLKRGQLATFFGYYKVYMVDGKPMAFFFARGFNPWYVPKAMDIKKYDDDSVEELTKENETSMLTYLDDIIKEMK